MSTGCQKKTHLDQVVKQSSKLLSNQSNQQINVESQLKPKNKVTFDKVFLRLENESGDESKIAEVNFNFYGSGLTSKNLEDQKSEIRNLILIHFANSNFKKIPEPNLSIKDPKLSTYLNQFLSSGQIEESEYKLVRVY